MSRTISIWYSDTRGNQTDIDVGNVDLLGTQQASKVFWSLPIHSQIGVKLLAELGVTDPVCFKGWKNIEQLEKELLLLERHLGKIPFDQGMKKRRIGNIRICLDTLKKSAPPDSVPEFMIG